MTRVNQGLILLFVAVATATLIRLLLPFGFSETKDILPEVYSIQKKSAAEQYLTDILAHNLWDEDRIALGSANNSAESGQAMSEGSPIELAQGGPASLLTLMGVSRGVGGVFAVIEFDQRTERYIPGELLPDGSRLEEVLEYGVRISKSGKDERLYLFGKN